jgi:hypothetical protein
MDLVLQLHDSHVTRRADKPARALKTLEKIASYQLIRMIS